MATYTDNYSLTKPTFAEVADIRTINGNMDTIDDIMHASQVSLADAYDQTATYNTGDVVMYEFLMYKCKEDNVTGNWDATKWERTTAAETGGGEVDFDFFGEASGNPASFADGAAANLVECIADIEAAQDLHGYDKPWAGGAGKNKLYSSLTSGVVNGVNYTIDSEGIIALSGTASAEAIKVGGFTLDAGSYLYSSEDDESFATYDTYITIRATGVTIARGMSGYEEFTLTEATELNLGIRVRNGVNVDGVVIKPMVRLSTAPSGFEPYSNICPIEGYDDITINVSPTSDPSQGVDTTIQLGDTYYGGTLDVTKGELTITHGFKTYTGDASENWIYSSSLNRVYINITDAIRPSAYAEIQSNILHYSLPQEDYGAYINDQGNLIVYAPSTITSASDWKTWLTSNNIQVVYELATPQTVQLTPTAINTLLGQNYISSEDTEDIDVVYTKSTAPIKPNPSGEPDGYLSSIELSGEKFEIIKELPAFPTSDGDYKLKLSVSSGVPTLSWVSDT